MKLFSKVYLAVGCLLLISSWYLTWKFYIYAGHLENSNAFYLRQRNQIIEKLASIHSTSLQVDTLIEKLGMSTSIIEKNFGPLFQKDYLRDNFLPQLNHASKEQVAALLLLQHTPLEIGTAVLPLTFPKVEARSRTAFQNTKVIQKLYERFKLNFLSIPTIMPTLGHLKSLFGYRRHPVDGETKFHTGIDIANIQGAPVIATADGRVSFAGPRGSYGNTVIINHTGTLQTQYSHLKTMRVRVSQSVHRGQVIGYVGSTGLSTGPHLHYEVHVHNRPQDPLQFIFN